MTDLPQLPMLPPADDAPETTLIPIPGDPGAAIVPADDAPEAIIIPVIDPVAAIIPADGIPAADLTPDFEFTFAGRPCHSRHDLAMAMADAWDEARAALITGELAHQLDACDLVAAAICRDQAANIAAGRFTPDRGVLEAIHRLSGETPVVWRGRRYAGASDLGGSLLQALRGTGVIPAHLDSLLLSGAASVFCDDATRCEGLQAIEARYASPDCAEREKTLLMYMVGYLLSGVAAFVTEGETFYTVEDLAAWLVGRSKRSPAAFTRACHRLLDENHLLDPQLEAWLCAIGCRQDVQKWQAEIDAGML
ncbi:MAG: hypothetical protein IJE07_13420 [Clostridia bacterium]|nr:hypothetical protein [Clostridia bacterium]